MVVLAADCGMPGAVSPLPARPMPGTPTAAPPTTAFVLTQSAGEEVVIDTLSAVALPGGRLLWSASIPGQTADLVVAPRMGQGLRPP